MKSENKREVTQNLPADYKLWLTTLKQTIRQTQIKAALKVNNELIGLYWNLGRDIAEKQLESTWGTGFFRQLSLDLKQEFPDMKGFSETNLKYIKRFYTFYNSNPLFRPQPADEKADLPIHHQPGDELQILLASIPWRHHIEIMVKTQNMDEALFYVQQTQQNGWSRAVLVHQIESGLYVRSGKAITNFSATLPVPQSDLAQQLTKDPYIFDLMGLTERYNERDLENHLASNITQFLLELGTGFTYYGRQVKLNVNGDDFFVDLMFYHLKLRCFVVVELKTVKFAPEHVGQLKFYLTAVDRQMRTDHDNPTIGLLICKDKNSVVAEYALQDIESPIGVSSYEIYRELTEKFEGSLPSIVELENELTNE